MPTHKVHPIGGDYEVDSSEEEDTRFGGGYNFTYNQFPGGGGHDDAHHVVDDEDSDDESVVAMDDHDDGHEQFSGSIAIEDDESDPRYQIQEDEDVGFASSKPVKQQSTGIKAREIPMAGGLEMMAHGTEQESEEEEVVDLMGIDDGAEKITGISQMPGGAGGFMNPEIEEKVKELAALLKKYKQKNQELRSKQKTSQKENEKLKLELIRLEEEKEESELKAEREMRMIQYKNMTGGGGGRNLSSDLEAQRKRDEARRQMYSNADQGDDDGVAIGLDDLSVNLGFLSKFYTKFQILVRKHFPLNRDLRRIDARFGSSVASYFYFFRWMITNYMSVSLVCLVFFIRHLLALFAYQNLSEAQRVATYNSANEPFTYYTWSASHWAELSSFLPKFMMLSSFNPGDTATIYTTNNIATKTDIYHANGTEATIQAYDSSMEMGERMDYIWMLSFCNGIMLVSAIVKWIREDRKSKAFGLFEDMDKQTRFAQTTLCAWDHGIWDHREVEDQKHSLLDQYFLNLHELKTSDLKSSRTIKERLTLFARRATSNLLYLAIQGSSGYAIIYLTTTSAQMSEYVLSLTQDNESLKWLSDILTVLSGSIVPIAVSILNGMLPAIIKLMTTFEKWDDAGFHTKLMLFRLFVAKSLNALIQIFSFLQLLDPYMLLGEPLVSTTFDRNTRMNTEKRFVTADGSTLASRVPMGLDECRADTFGAGVFQLVVTEFIISKIAFFVTPFSIWIISKIRKKPYERKEFEVAKQMVNLLFFQQLCFMSFPFFPFGTLIVVMMMFAGFKIEKIVLEKFMCKPKKPWSAKDAANFFIKFFFFTFLVSSSVSIFVLTNRNFPKACTLQEHITKDTYDSHPLGQCFDSDPSKDDADDIVCFLRNRTIEKIKAGSGRTPGLEELRFWEEYFVAKNKDIIPTDETKVIETEAYIRALTGYSSEKAASYPSLLVCTLSCGPFIYNVNFYAPLDIFMNENFSTLYKLLTQDPVAIWSVAILVLLRYVFTKNTIRVLHQLQAEKEIALRNLVANLEAKIKKLTNRVEKMKQA